MSEWWRAGDDGGLGGGRGLEKEADGGGDEGAAIIIAWLGLKFELELDACPPIRS